MEAIYKEAHEAGLVAFNAAKPVPMIVTWEGGREFVDDGVCGFAWIIIKPARGPFVKYLKDNKIGYKRDYGGGGYMVSPKGEAGFSQSMQRKEAYARAFAGVLKSYGIDCWVESRLD
jgi:hypothetical protein